MAQLSIFLDDKILRKVERAAREDHKSISKWVSEKLNNNLVFDHPMEESLKADQVKM